MKTSYFICFLEHNQIILENNPNKDLGTTTAVTKLKMRLLHKVYLQVLSTQ